MLCFLPFLILHVIIISQAQPHNNGGGFIKVNGLNFILEQDPYYPNGFNSYWMMSIASDPTQRFKVTSAFQEASKYGLTLARTWAFSDGPGSSSLQTYPGQYNEPVFQGLDFVIGEASKYKIKLVLSLVNNYNDYGGRKQYVDWARSTGGEAVDLSSDDVFYSSEVVKQFYKNHVKV